MEYLLLKAMLISNIDDPGKVPNYVTRPAKINQILVLDVVLWILTHVSGYTIRIIMDAFTESELEFTFTV